MQTFAYNLLMAITDLFLIAICRQTRHLRIYWGTLFFFVFFSFVLAMICGKDVFDTLRLFAWAVFLHLPVLIFASAVLCRRSYPKLSILGFLAVVIFESIWFYAFWIEPFRLEVTSYTISSKKIKTPLKIAILADLQTDVLGEYEKEVFFRMMSEKPDIILLPGDFVQADSEEAQQALYQALNKFLKTIPFQAPQGIFAVEGNTDEAGWPLIFEGLPVKIFLKTEQVQTSFLQITGLSMRDSFSPLLQVVSPDTSVFHLVFGHAPDFALGEIEADVLVAGHTHGGQVQIPGFGPLLTFSAVPRAWADGRTDLANGKILIVSRGIGMERHHAPRLRFFCRPQLVILELSPSPS